MNTRLFLSARLKRSTFSRSFCFPFLFIAIFTRVAQRSALIIFTFLGHWLWVTNTNNTQLPLTLHKLCFLDFFFTEIGKFCQYSYSNSKITPFPFLNSGKRKLTNLNSRRRLLLCQIFPLMMISQFSQQLGPKKYIFKFEGECNRIYFFLLLHKIDSA